MKKIVIIVSVVIFIIIGFIVIKEMTNPNLKYSQEYVVGKSNIKGNVDIEFFTSKSEDFAIGANKYGYAVFKNPSKAFKQLKKEYSKGIELIQKEFNLLPLNNFNYKDYKTYGWQVTTGTEEEQNEARFVSSFMDIYENSFSK